MSQCARVKRPNYLERLKQFANARIFREVDFVWDANGHKCDACGSAAPKKLRLIEDISGNRYQVGNECYMHLRLAFDEWPEVKRLGRAFELWVKQTEASIGYRHTWQLVELYKHQNSEDKAR